MPTIEMKTELPGPRSRAIIERKERVVCDPLDLHVNTVIDHGLGAAVTDVDGNTMLDLSSGLGCLLVGHSHPKVVEAVQRQAAKFSHTDFSVVPYEIYVELCERLVERVGPGRKVALFNSGAEAVENAVKFAKAATGRQAVICFEGAFHGRTLLTMSLTSRHTPYKRGFGPFAAEVYRVPFSYPYRSEDPDGRLALEAFERAFVTTVDPRIRGRGHLRARAGRGRLHRAGWRVPAGRRGALSHARHPDDRRRDPVGVRPHGQVPGERALRARPRHRDPGEGARVGVSAVGGGRQDRDHGRPRPVRDRRHVRGQPRRVRGRRRGARRDRGGGLDRTGGRGRQGDPHPLGAARRRHPGGRRRARPRLHGRASRWCPTGRRRSRTARTSDG